MLSSATESKDMNIFSAIWFGQQHVSECRARRDLRSTSAMGLVLSCCFWNPATCEEA